MYQLENTSATLVEAATNSMPVPQFVVRPFLNSDFDLQRDFFAQLTPADLHARFLAPRRAVSDPLLRFLSRVDHETHVLMIATKPSRDRQHMVGEARLVNAPDAPDKAEFAVAVSACAKGTGLAGRLLQVLEHRARSAGRTEIFGECLWSNKAMLGLAIRQGYRVRVHPRDGTLSRMTKCLVSAQTLNPELAAGQHRIAA